MIRRIVVIVALALAAAGAASAATEFRIPVPEKRTLPNGLLVVAFPRPGAGLVQVQLVVAAGVDAEPPDAPGVATLTARMLRYGTSSRTADVFGRDLARLGGTLSIAAQREHAAIGAVFLPDDFESGMELVSDAVINPIFDDAQFALVRNQAARELVQLHADPLNTADEQLWALALPGVAAARLPLGDLSSLFALTGDPLHDFHRSRYRPDRAVLAIGGDVTADKAFAVATEWFGRWAGRAAPAAAPVTAPAATVRVRVVTREDLPLAVVRLGWIVPGRAETDELPRTIGARLLEARLRRRLAPITIGGGGVDLKLGVVRGAGLLSLGLAVPIDSVAAAVSRARRAMRDAIGTAVTESELAPLKTQILQGYPLRFETLGGVMSQWLSAYLDGGDVDRTLAEERGHIAEIAPAAVTAALRRGLDLDAPAIVVVGPAARIGGSLSRLGSVEVVKLDQPPAGAAAAQDTLPPPTAADAGLGRQLAARAVEAHGGAAKIRGIHDTVVESRVTFLLQGRELHGEMRQLRAEPYRMVFLTSFDQFESRQVLNGHEAWSLAQDGHLEESDSVSVQALRAGFASDVPHLLLALADSTTRLVSRGLATFDGRKVRVLDMSTPGGERRRVYLDAETSRLAGMDQNEEGAGGGLGARRIYRDLRPVDGIQLPFEEERQLEGQTVMHLFATRVAVNAGVQDAEFQRPTSVPVAPKK